MAEDATISAGTGGTSALEFVNTVAWHLAPEPIERLGEWRDVVRWAAEQKLVERDQIDRLARVAADMAWVRDLREAIFRAGVAAARDERPDVGDLGTIVERASAPPPAARWAGGRLSWRYGDDHVVSELLGVIARDAVALFAGERVNRLRLCAGQHCGWLFIDESRGKPRRWCSMSDCGNRAKARRAYSRRKGWRGSAALSSRPPS